MLITVFLDSSKKLKYFICSCLPLIDNRFVQTEDNSKLLKLVVYCLEFYYHESSSIDQNKGELKRLPQVLKEFILTSEIVRSLPFLWKNLNQSDEDYIIFARIYLVISVMNLDDLEDVIEEQAVGLFSELILTTNEFALVDILFALSNFTGNSLVLEMMKSDKTFCMLVEMLYNYR